jgi:hypothetical protein
MGVHAVAAAKHAEGQLGVVHHRRHRQARGPEPRPVRPRALHPVLRGHRRREGQGGRRELLRRGCIRRGAGAEVLVGVGEVGGGGRHGAARV